MPRVGTVVLAAYLLAAGLIPVIVDRGAASLHQPHDVILVAIVMLFAVGVVASIGYMQSTALTEKLESLSGAAELLCHGTLSRARRDR